MKFKVLIAEGDSWSGGHEVNPELYQQIGDHVNHELNDDWRLPRLWPHKLAKKLEINVENLSHAGSSNDGIFKRVLNNLDDLLKKYPSEDILFIIGFTTPERKDFYFTNGKQKFWDIMQPNNVDAPHLDSHRKNFYSAYARNFWNEEEYFTRYIQTVISLHYILKAKNIKHLFFQAFYEDMNAGLRHGFSFLSKLKKFKYSKSYDMLKGLEIHNTLEEYFKIHKKYFLNCSFKEFNDFYKIDKIVDYHPTEYAQEQWSKFLKSYIDKEYSVYVEDEINTATLHNPSKKILDYYKDVPEINELDNRGYPICRPLFSTSELGKYLNLKKLEHNELKPDQKFLYITLLHHDNPLCAKNIKLIPEYVLNAVREKKCKLILDNSLEGHNILFFLKPLYKSINELSIPESQIYYLTNNLYAENHHQKWLKKNSIEKSINVISYMYNVYDVKRLSHSKGIIEGGKLPKYVDIQKIIDYKIKNLEKTKHFLKVNRTGRPERNLFMLYLNKYNLFNKFKISFPEYGEEGAYNLFTELTTEENINSLKSKLPFDIDHTDEENHGPPGQGKGKFDADLPFQIKHYDDTFISVVMCAFPFDDACHLHSSTFNPMYCGHPVIQFGPKGHLAEMRKRGFKTFNRWWDESYDDINDGWERFRAILKIVHKLSFKTKEEMLEMYIGMKEVLQHNSDLIFNYNFDLAVTNKIIYYNGIPKLIK